MSEITLIGAEEVYAKCVEIVRDPSHASGEEVYSALKFVVSIPTDGIVPFLDKLIQRGEPANIGVIAEHGKRKISSLPPEEKTVEHYANRVRAIQQSRESEMGLFAQSPESYPLYCLGLTDNDLWNVIRRKATSVAFRIAALHELTERKSQRLPAFIDDDLKKPNLSLRWRDALVASAARTQFIDSAQRSSIANSLLNIAFSLSQDAEALSHEGTLWRAVRRYAALRPEADISQFASLIPSTQGYLAFHHILLLSLANAFSAWPPMSAEQNRLEPLRAWVVNGLHLSLQQPDFESLLDEAIAQCGLVSAGALAVSEFKALCLRVNTHPQAWLWDMAKDELEAIKARWQQRELHDQGEQAALALLLDGLGSLKERVR